MSPMAWTVQQALRPPPTYAATINRPPRHPRGYHRATRGVLEHLERRPVALTVAQLVAKLKVHDSTIYNALRELRRDGAVREIKDVSVGANYRPISAWRATKWRT